MHTNCYPILKAASNYRISIKSNSDCPQASFYTSKRDVGVCTVEKALVVTVKCEDGIDDVIVVIFKWAACSSPFSLTD